MKALKNTMRRATLVALYIGGLGFSAMLDVVMAVFAMHFLAIFFDTSLQWYHYVLAAPLIGVLPDITSTLLQLLTQKKIDDTHHEIYFDGIIIPLATLFFFIGGYASFLINSIIAFCNIPLTSIPYDAVVIPFTLKLAVVAGIFMLLAPFAHIVIPIITVGLLLGWLFFSPFWGIVIATAFVFHYFHDSCCLDFGLKWLWPFNNNQYHFGGRLAMGKKITPLPFRFVYTFMPEMIEASRKQFMDVISWIRNVYLVPTTYAIGELYVSLFLLTAIALTSNLQIGILGGLLIPIALGILLMILWAASAVYETVTGESFQDA